MESSLHCQLKEWLGPGAGGRAEVAVAEVGQPAAHRADPEAAVAVCAQGADVAVGQAVWPGVMREPPAGEVEQALAGATNLNPAAQQKLSELGALRARLLVSSNELANGARKITNRRV